MDLSIVVLAAGKGTRMKSSLPKVLHVIGGKPMLEHVIDAAKMLSPAKMIVVYGFGKEALKQAIQNENITWVEQPAQLGTGDALLKAIPHIPKNHRVLILYGDVPLITTHTIRNLINTTPESGVGLLTARLDEPAGLGRVIRDNAGEITRIVEEKDANEIERRIQEINTGILLVSAEHLHHWLPKIKNDNSQGEYYLTDVIKFAVEDKVKIVSVQPQTAEEVLGINDRFQQSQAERYYQLQVAKQLLREGVWIKDPNRFDLRGTISAQHDVSIDINVIFEGRVVLHAGSQIGPNCILINCEIGEGAQILANSHLEGVTVGKNARIGPFARIRPKTVIDQNARVGNFVEMKQTCIGEGSKVNHLSYIGDAIIGKDVNVGAGTITCNFDGANKHQTIIEDDVHVGSDTQLIAPIKVGRGATVGAGSTLHRDVPPDQLTLTNRLEFRSKKWERPKKADLTTKNN